MSFWRDLNSMVNNVLPTAAGVAGTLISPTVGALAANVVGGVVRSGQSQPSGQTQVQTTTGSPVRVIEPTNDPNGRGNTTNTPNGGLVKTNILWIVGGVVVVLGALFYFFKKKK